jgi:hypothetical protein
VAVQWNASPCAYVSRRSTGVFHDFLMTSITRKVETWVRFRRAQTIWASRSISATNTMILRVLLLVGATISAFGQTGTPTAPSLWSRLNAIETAAKSAQRTGHNAWILARAALVLMMRGPGLVLFCGGLVWKKMKFTAMLLFTAVWMLMVYLPQTHMVWGEGGLLNAALGGKFSCFDFAGNTVVHITSELSVLVCAFYPRRRQGSPGNHEAAQREVLRLRNW